MASNRMKLDINHLYEMIDEILGDESSAKVSEHGFAVAIGLELLANYLKAIALRAIEIEDNDLIELMLDLHVLKEEKEAEQDGL